uniref:nucleotidyltransferase domain-containing protein n=1 Tax=Butyricimonas virosa TaxID=544645 RepID=UPI00402A3F60
MEERIRQYIKEIEKAQDIKVLLACETGSRAWGFPSPDSDYDVRLIYRHRMDWYLSLLEPKDIFEVMLEDNNFDISGWDIRKTLGLLWKSNPPLLERIQSPIVYVADEEFLIGMNSIAPRCYSRVATIHHYLSMAKKCFEEINGKESYKLKKFFYALRAAVACRWILETDRIPPIRFSEMLEGIHVSGDLYERIGELIKLKSRENESYFHKGEAAVIAFIDESIALGEERGKCLPAASGDIFELDTFFRNVVKKEL